MIQYGTKPKSSWPGFGTGDGAADGSPPIRPAASPSPDAPARGDPFWPAALLDRGEPVKPGFPDPSRRTASTTVTATATAPTPRRGRRVMTLRIGRTPAGPLSRSG